MTFITVVQNDFGYNLIFNLLDSAGNVFSLVGATEVYFRSQFSTSSQITTVGTMTITDASNGQCEYTVASGDFSLAGDYNVQIQTVFGSSETVTFPNIKVTASPRVPVQV